MSLVIEEFPALPTHAAYQRQGGQSLALYDVVWGPSSAFPGPLEL